MIFNRLFHLKEQTRWKAQYFQVFAFKVRHWPYKAIYIQSIPITTFFY